MTCNTVGWKKWRLEYAEKKTKKQGRRGERKTGWWKESRKKKWKGYWRSKELRGSFLHFLFCVLFL